MLQDPFSLGDNDDVHDHVLWQPDGRPEVPGQGHQQVEDGHNVLGVDRLHAPLVDATSGPLHTKVGRYILILSEYISTPYLKIVRFESWYLVDAKNLVGKPQNDSELCPLAFLRL